MLLVIASKTSCISADLGMHSPGGKQLMRKMCKSFALISLSPSFLHTFRSNVANLASIVCLFFCAISALPLSSRMEDPAYNENHRKNFNSSEESTNIHTTNKYSHALYNSAGDLIKRFGNWFCPEKGLVTPSFLLHQHIMIV